MIKLLMRFYDVNSGEILIDGHNILEEPEEAKKKIGYLPEIPPLYVDMTVSEILEICS